MRFLGFTLLCLVLCVTGYGALAYLVNPRGDFATNFFPRVVLPDRAERLRLFEDFARKAPPTGLILGSSRSMKLKPSELDQAFGGRFFNFAVTSARVEDYCAIYAWVRQHGIVPRLLIIGLDVEALHSNDQYKDMLNVPELRAAFEGRRLSAVDRLQEMFAKARDMYKLGYAVDVFRSIRLKWKSTPPAYAFESDGYVRFLRAERGRAAVGSAEFAQSISDCAAQYRGMYKEMSALSPRRRGYLEALVRRAQADGARVLIWITPLHPAALSVIANGTSYVELVRQTVAFADSLRDRYHITVADMHDPAAYGAADSPWYDCVHYDEVAARRITAVLRQRQSAE